MLSVAIWKSGLVNEKSVALENIRKVFEEVEKFYSGVTAMLAYGIGALQATKPCHKGELAMMYFR